MFLKKRWLVLGLLIVGLLVSNPTVNNRVEAKTVNLKLLMVDWNRDVKKLFDEHTIPLFEKKNPNIKVSVDYTKWGELDIKVMTGFAAGIAPDLFQADAVEFGPKYFEKGAVLPLNPYIDTAPKKVMDDFPAVSIEGAAINGNIIALPYLYDNRTLFYRKDFFREAGLDPEVPPRNWEEFREAAIKLTKYDTNGRIKRAGWLNGAGTAGYVYGLYQVFVQFLWQNKGSLLNETQSKAIFNNPAGLEALQFMVSLVREDKVCPVEGVRDVGDLSPLTAGIVAMNFGNYGSIRNIKKYKPELYKEIGITVLGQKQKAGLYYANSYLMSRGEHPDEAWKLLSFLVLDRENLADYIELVGQLPPRKSLLPILNEPLGKILFEGVMDAPGTKTSPQTTCTVELMDRIGAGIEAALYGKMTSKQALDKAANECNSVLKRAGY